MTLQLTEDCLQQLLMIYARLGVINKNFVIYPKNLPPQDTTFIRLITMTMTADI